VAGYLKIVAHYENCLEKHGDSHLGVDWPNQADAHTRYRVMMDLLPGSETKTPVDLLDFGCGASHLYEFLQKHGTQPINYSGLDLSEQFVALAKKKFPENPYYHLDVLQPEQFARLPAFDYIVMNGVFTEKVDLSQAEMKAFFEEVVALVFTKAKKGIAFNVMSKHVDWERRDLFHLPYDELAAFLKSKVSRHFAFRADYGLYEYTAYVYRQPRSLRGPAAARESAG
jgi:SAM-dependent methyltransferase